MKNKIKIYLLLDNYIYVKLKIIEHNKKYIKHKNAFEL